MFTRYPLTMKSHPQAFRVATPVVGPLAMRLTATLRLWRERARMRGELRRIDERLLADVGLSVRDADREAAKPFWRK